MLLAVIALAFLLYLKQTSLREEFEQRYESRLLITELKKSSDDLTTSCRNYVLTGNEKWEREYWDILKIRNGELPR